jgi:hypothetical protein
LDSRTFDRAYKFRRTLKNRRKTHASHVIFNSCESAGIRRVGGELKNSAAVNPPAPRGVLISLDHAALAWEIDQAKSHRRKPPKRPMGMEGILRQAKMQIWLGGRGQSAFQLRMAGGTVC